MGYLILVLKILIWILMIGLISNIVLQRVSYSFYKKAKSFEHIEFKPVKININKKLVGYAYNLDLSSNNVVIMFGGSGYTAFNTIGVYGGFYNCPVFAVDYYGSQDSLGKMNLKTMKQSAIELYDWIAEHYSIKNITIIGHSYGAGMASYLASVKKCDNLILLSAYRDLSDLYNRIIPIFHGPMKLFLTNNISIQLYAKSTTCKVYIFGSYQDHILNEKLQRKVLNCYKHAKLNIYEKIKHEEYLVNDQVIAAIKKIIFE